ncbi:MAG: hypothetical protein LBT84_06760 [Spirochaetia bacterium]|jgi:hypothetical protein|nr:hypothetical protein [Spirochaetia bacterium]
MKLVSEVTVALKKSALSQLVDKFNESGCVLKSMSLYESTEYENAYVCELIYQHSSEFLNCVEILKNSDKFTFISTDSSLEKTLTGGLLEISGKLPFETPQDYEINVLGGAEIINDKIEKGLDDYCGIENMAANVCAVTDRGSKKKKLYQLYTIAERDSLIMKKFTAMNCIPLSFQYSQPEDCLRYLRNSAVGFKAMRILEVEDASLSFYSQLLDGFPAPLIIRELDELPLYVLSLVNKCVHKHRFNPDETNIGVLGVDNGVIRMTRLFLRSGFRRVLGYDGDENILLEFEGEDGLATTKENILRNADLIIIMKNNFTNQDLANMRPGQLVISMIKDSGADKDTLLNNGIREFIQGNTDDLTLIFPALLQGIIHAGLSYFDDTRLIELSEKIAKFMSQDYTFPELPESVLGMISDFIVLSSYPQN